VLTTFQSTAVDYLVSQIIDQEGFTFWPPYLRLGGGNERTNWGCKDNLNHWKILEFSSLIGKF